eukprot:1159344-Pelagomonas_calceolata.AAC.14
MSSTRFHAHACPGRHCTHTVGARRPEPRVHRFISNQACQLCTAACLAHTLSHTGLPTLTGFHTQVRRVVTWPFIMFVQDYHLVTRRQEVYVLAWV